MNEESKSRMFLFTTAGIALIGLSLEVAMVVALRQMGVPWWIDTLALPMGLGTGLLATTISARMWKM